MSERREESAGDWGSRNLDPEELADAELNLDDPEAGDDEPWTPPERQPRPAEFLDETESETIDQRLTQEEPDPGTDYGDPALGEPEDEETLGGDDPDAIPADQDVLGGPAYSTSDRVDVLEEDDLGDGPEGDAMHIDEE